MQGLCHYMSYVWTFSAVIKVYFMKSPGVTVCTDRIFRMLDRRREVWLEWKLLRTILQPDLL
jgi:hypothetical protein